MLKTTSQSFASFQEQIVFGFSEHILGKQSLFCPDCYGNSEEPADIVWIENRCAILMYMTKSKGSYQKKQRHNLSQLHRWLKVWQSGKTLTGRTEHTKYEFKFEDIDHIIGLSIIDGGEVWCENLPDQVIYSKNRKLSACAAFTSNVISELANTGATPRDLLSLIVNMRDGNSKLYLESDIIKKIRTKTANDIYQLRCELKPYLDKITALNPDFNEVDEFIKSTKMRPEAREIGSLSADLKQTDINWFNLSYAVFSNLIALPSEQGNICIYAKRYSGIYKLECLIAANTTVLVEKKELLTNESPGLSLIIGFDFGLYAPIKMLAVQQRTGTSLLELEAQEFREKILVSR